jgi:hypothetical protein
VVSVNPFFQSRSGRCRATYRDVVGAAPKKAAAPGQPSPRRHMCSSRTTQRGTNDLPVAAPNPAHLPCARVPGRQRGGLIQA